MNTHTRFDEYVEVTLDPSRTEIQRQEFNPFFMEFGFFNTINKVGEDTDLPRNEKSIKGKSKRYDITINS